MLRYLDAILTVTPDAAEERWVRAVLRYQTGDRAATLRTWTGCSNIIPRE